MTVNTTNITSGPYAGNDIADTFNYDFRVEDKTQLKVFETDDAGVETTLTVDTDYTVNTVGDDAGGTITRVAGALPTNYQWYIRSDYKYTQLTALPSQGPFFPDVHEAVMDKLTFLIQQLLDGDDRTFRLSDSIDIDGVFTISDDAVARANNFLSFDSNGDLIITSGVSGVPTSAAWANVIEQVTITLGLTEMGFSDFAQTLIDDADADAHWATIMATINKVTARASLGVAIGTDVQAYNANIPIVAMSQAEAEAGTSTALRTTTAERQAQAIAALTPVYIFTKSFTSAEQTITSGGGLTLAHGLGASASLIQARIICKVSDANYAIGDEVIINPAGNDPDSAAARGLGMWPDATNINVRYGSNAGALRIMDKTGGNAVTIINASWRLIVRAWS